MEKTINKKLTEENVYSVMKEHGFEYAKIVCNEKVFKELKWKIKNVEFELNNGCKNNEWYLIPFTSIHSIT